MMSWVTTELDDESVEEGNVTEAYAELRRFWQSEHSWLFSITGIDVEEKGLIEQRPIEKMTSKTRSPEVVQESAGEVGMEDYRTYEERNGLSVDAVYSQSDRGHGS